MSVSEEDLSTCRSRHSCTFLGSDRQSVVRRPGTDLGSACQQQILLIWTERPHKCTVIGEHMQNPQSEQVCVLHLNKTSKSFCYKYLMVFQQDCICIIENNVILYKKNKKNSSLKPFKDFFFQFQTII